jgi:biopolymer transport protein ExbD
MKMLILIFVLLVSLASCSQDTEIDEINGHKTATEAGEDYEYSYTIDDEERTRGSVKIPQPGEEGQRGQGAEAIVPKKISYSTFSAEAKELLHEHIVSVIGDVNYSMQVNVTDENDIYNSAEEYLRDSTHYPVVLITASINEPYYYATKLQSALRENGYYATVYISN